MRRFFFRFSVAVALLALIYPATQPQSEPINPYVLTAAKIAAALGYTPAIARLPVTGEKGVTDITYLPGNAARYGVGCNGSTDYSGQFDTFLLNAMLPGVTPVVPACKYNFGVSTRAIMSGARPYFTPGSKLVGLWHQIANGSNGQSPTATCTITTGAVSAVALTTATVTIDIPSSTVTWTAHGKTNGTAVVLTNSGGNLPTGYTSGTTLFMVGVTTNTFQLSTTSTGSAITLSGTQAGTQTATLHGTGYFNTADVIASGSDSTHVLTGSIITAVMEADYVDNIAFGGSGYATNDTVTDGDGTVYTITATSAGGVATTATVTTRVSVTDPTATGYYNRKTQSSTSGTGTGIYIFTAYRPASLTLTNGGSGGGSTSCVVSVRPPTLYNFSAYGSISSDGRLGVQSTVNNYIEEFNALDNPTESGSGNCGSHLDANDNLYIKRYTAYNATATSGVCGWAAFTAETSGGFPQRALRVDYIHIKKADVHAIAMCGEVNIGEIIVDSFGLASSDPTQAYCGPQSSAQAAGVFLYRAHGHIGTIRVNQNDAAIGTLAKYSVLIPSTGQYPIQGYQTDNNLASLANSAAWGLTIDNVFISNASRQGGFVMGDKNNVDNGGVGLSVSIAGQLKIQASMSTAQTSGYQLLTVNNPGNTSPNLRSEFYANNVSMLSTGASIDNITPPAAIDAFSCASTSNVTIGTMRIPYHGGGNSGLLQINCRYRGTVDMDQIDNYGLTAGSNALFQFSGSGTAGTNVVIEADSGANHYNGPFATFAGTTDVTFGGSISNYRNVALATSGTNNDLKINNLIMNGIPTNGTAISFAGTLNRLQFTNSYFTGWVTAIAASSPTFVDSYTDKVMFGSNTTNNGLAASAFTVAIASLPTTAITGTTRVVNNQLTTCAVAGAALTAGGSVVCPVFYNGSAWVGQ